MTDDSQSNDSYDPVFLHARREALVLLVAFVVFLVWTILTCYILGYRQPTVDVRTVWGMPRWVFWGVVVPWMAANVFTFAFAWFYMVNDPLGQAATEEQPRADATEGMNE